MVVYADILMAVNGWIDFLLLCAVRRLNGGEGRGWRLAAGAMAGAVYSLVLFLPPLAWWLAALTEALAAAVIVLIAFGWGDGRRFCRRLLWMLALSAGWAGAATMISKWLSPAGMTVWNGVVYYAISPLWLVGLTTAAYGIQWIAEKRMRHRAPDRRTFTVRIRTGERTAGLCCLYDSGNHLTEPFSGRPVLIAEQSALRRLMPVVPTPQTLPETGGWRVVPFSSVGGDGLLAAFPPDEVTVVTAGRKQILQPCYIAICETLGNGEYQGLLGSGFGDELLE